MTLDIALFIAGTAGLFLLHRKKVSFNLQVLTALAGAVAFGFFIARSDPDAAARSMRWISLPGNLYVRLLKMMVIPLIFVSIVRAIAGQKSGGGLGKIAGLSLLFLLGTAALSAAVGGLTAMGFGLSAEGIAAGNAGEQAVRTLEGQAGEMKSLDAMILGIIPQNPFYALCGLGENATLSVVLIACLIGIALHGVRTYEPEQAELFTRWIQALNTLVVEIVMMIILLTPYGIFSLMTGTVAGGAFEGIVKLLKFVLASYTAIGAMFLIHGLLLAMLGLNPLIYFRKALPALTFAFTSRTSAGTLPLTIRTLTEKMGVPDGVANLTASLSVSIGQNGCAGIYPAMLTVMVLPAAGREMTPGFFLVMMLTVTLVSIGIAGVGGGATFAGIMVLSALGLPVGIAGLLIAVEPLIDMGRTALNVSDGMVSSLGTAALSGSLEKKVYCNPSAEFVDKAVKS